MFAINYSNNKVIHASTMSYLKKSDLIEAISTYNISFVILTNNNLRLSNVSTSFESEFKEFKEVDDFIRYEKQLYKNEEITIK